MPISASTSRPFGRRLATDETAHDTCQMLLVAAIVLSRRLHARASERFRPVRLLPQNEFKSCRRGQRGLSCGTTGPERPPGEAPKTIILRPSREAFRVEGEHVPLLSSLDCPPEDADLTALEALRYPATQLFMERASASGHGAALSDIDAPIV